MKKLVLTFDLEFCYNGEFVKRYLPKDKSSLEDFVEKPTKVVLELLKRYNQRATFFVLGQLAEKYPELIKKISDSGHEVSSHGYSHKALDELSKDEFEKEIQLSKNIIKNIINKEPKGFRAPNFSLNKKTGWALEILGKNGFQYDSSIHPLKLSNIPGEILEIPPSLGGIYFRIFPLKLYLFLIKHISKTEVPVLYFHPYELFAEAPQINSLPWLKRKIKYYGMKNAFKKFEKLMEKFDFISIKQYLNENSPN